MTSRPSRRALLLGGAGLALGACGADRVPGSGGATVSGSFLSDRMNGARTGWTVAYPKGSDEDARLPVVLTLHGRGDDHATAFERLHLDDVLDDLVSDGVPPFAVASVDGGDSSYWHRRADGTDPQAMLRDEFLPLLEQRGLDRGRVALHGWSMGGYAAMLLVRTARRWLDPKGVAVAQPALFATAGVTSAGAFDDADDFDRHDVGAHPEWLKDVPLRVDCGTEDPFYAATKDFVGRMRPRPSGGFSRGGHDSSFVRKVAPAQLRFLGTLLT